MTTSTKEPFIVKCPGCGQANRLTLPGKDRKARCGKCKREFATQEITRAFFASMLEGFKGKLNI
jgi:hypothetical protein